MCSNGETVEPAFLTNSFLQNSFTSILEKEKVFSYHINLS